jgi:hypothetical protein
MKPNTKAVDIGAVVLAELKDICYRRGLGDLVHSAKTWEQQCHEQKLFGISLSGGGIRSATFALGVFQGLTEKGLLPKADYLSTVSGGGYIGAWLQGILYRGCGYTALEEHVPGPSRTDPVTFLRKYSNYLAPRVGFSLDAIVIPVIWFRNMLLNQAIIVSAFASLFLLLLLPGVGVRLVSVRGSPRIGLFLAAVSGGIAVVTIGRSLRAITKREFEGCATPAVAVGRGVARVGTLVVLPLLGAVVCLLLASISPGQSFGSRQGKVTTFLLLWFLIVLLQRGGGFISCYEQSHWYPTVALRQWLEPRFQMLWISLATASFMHVLLYQVSRLLILWEPSSPEGSQNAIAWMPPLYLVVLMLGITLQVGLMGRDFPDASREWLARCGALIAMVAAAWVFFFAVAVFSPRWVAWTWLSRKPAIVSGISAWIASTLATVLAGKSGKTKGGAQDQNHFSATLEALARYGPFIAVPGFLIAVAFGTQAFLHVVTERVDGRFLPAFLNSYWQALPYEASSWKIYLPVLAASCVTFALLSLRVNINEFSMHHFYKNRLVRCYLGASATAKRIADSFTGFDSQDDIPLSRLSCNATPSIRAPYPIVNATLNVTVGSELATQERKALPWIFTPRYSGFVPAQSDADRVVIEEKYLDKAFADSSTILGGGLHLGTATAISGAAVNPNMGFHGAPQTAFLLTLFNVRLGWWVGNPRDARTYCCSGPWFALWWLIRELLGTVNVRSGFVNLSDGGHFENLGLYELVRRRCRYVIVVDGEEDPQYEFNSLGSVVRKCRADFGVEIEIDPRPIQPEKGYSRRHCVVGRIRYPERNSEQGWLLYIKTSITGDEPADVEEYRRTQVEFPQQSTVDQFFSESQFESYRRLGLHEVRTVLDHFDRALSLDDSFARLLSRWQPAPQAHEGTFERHAEAYSRLMGRLDTCNDLNVLHQEVFENVPPGLATNRIVRESFFFCLDLLELMETVFRDLDLASEYSWHHPGNAGWKRNLEYWAQQESIGNVWKAQKRNYSTPFQDFFDDLVNQRSRSREEHRQ